MSFKYVSKMVPTNYVLSLILLLHSICECVTKFEKDGSIQGLCSPIELDFGDVDRPILCAILCDRDTDCIGFFHSLGQRSCFGVKTVALTGCTGTGDHLFYRKDLPPTTTTTAAPASFPTTCSSNTDCTNGAANSFCELGVCQCTISTVYDPGTSTCATSCTSYGSTFTTFNGHYLGVSSGAEYTGVSESACLAHCASNANCRSANYAASMGNLCTLKYTSARENSGAFGSNGGINHHVRNCA